jgi:hypothetical protein
MSKMNTQQKRFIYIIETPTESKELDIEETELIENADGELDCPLDHVLSRHQLGLTDLFNMQVAHVSLVEENVFERKLIRSICFEHLRYNK